MNKLVTIGTVWAVCGLASLPGGALGQNAPDKKPAQPLKVEAPKVSAPKADAPKAQPAGQAEGMDKMMEAWMKSATPGKMHERLTSNVGVWEGKVKQWMQPGDTPKESVCTTTITSMLGGRFTKGETKGKMDMGMPVDFEGFGLYGYNNTTEKFESTWCDNLGTVIMNFTGSLSADGKTLTSISKFADPFTKKETWMKEVETTTGPDAMTLEMFAPGPDGKEFKMMQIDYTRKSGAKATEKTTEQKQSPAGH